MKKSLLLFGLLPAFVQPVFAFTNDQPIWEAVGEGHLRSWTIEEQGVFSFGFANSRYREKDLNQTLLKLCKNPQTRSLVDYKMIMASYFPNNEPLAIMIVDHLNCRQLIKNGHVSIQYQRY